VQEAMAETRTGGKEVEVAMVDLRLFDELCDAGGSESMQ
jgi:hypothetical protein